MVPLNLTPATVNLYWAVIGVGMLSFLAPMLAALFMRWLRIFWL